MFEDARLLGTHREDRKIIIQTREGTNLDNFVGPKAGIQCPKKFAILRKRFGANWELRKPATGGYNCAGMVWASRRAVLWNPADWEQVIKDDGYRQLQANETSTIGDVVVYRQAGNEEEILHVARICRIDKLEIQGIRTHGTPRALSKWDLTSGEVIHALEDVFLNGGEAFNYILYTDRPLT